MDYQTNESQRNKAFSPLGESPAAAPAPRRVGTITMGVALVGAGILLLVGQFRLLNMAALLRWSPVILILLGVEILLGYALNRGQKLRYDFLSMFVCLVLICGSGICSLIPMAAAYEQNERLAERQVSQQLEQQVAQAVGQENFGSLYVDVNGLYAQGWNAFAVPTTEEMLQAETYSCYIGLELLGEYPDEAAFASAAAQAASRIQALNLTALRGVELSGYGPQGSYELHLDRWGLGVSADELIRQIDYERDESADQDSWD